MTRFKLIVFAFARVTANGQSVLAFHLGGSCMPPTRLVEVGADCGILWRVAGGEGTSAMVSGDHGWRAAIADFDGDGQDDLLWHGPGSDKAEFWPRGRAREALSIPIGGDHVPSIGHARAGTEMRPRQRATAASRR